MEGYYNGNEAVSKPRAAGAAQESPSTPGPSITKVEEEVVSIDPSHDERLTFAKRAKFAYVRNEMETLLMHLEGINGPPGDLIFSTLDKLIQDWINLVEDLNRADGRCARAGDLTKHPILVLEAGIATIENYRKVGGRYEAVSDLELVIESIFGRAEGLVRGLNAVDSGAAKCSSTRVSDLGDEETPTEATCSLQDRHHKIILEIINRVRALSSNLEKKRDQMRRN